MSAALRVLISASSSEAAELLSNELIRAGYDVSSVLVNSRDSADQALRSASWDVILSEHSNPGFTALDALALLRERECDIPFIVISDRIDAEMAVELVKAGAHDCVPKGSLDRLAPSIERERNDARMRRQRRLGRNA